MTNLPKLWRLREKDGIHLFIYRKYLLATTLRMPYVWLQPLYNVFVKGLRHRREYFHLGMCECLVFRFFYSSKSLWR